jgi:hypothetical protein
MTAHDEEDIFRYLSGHLSPSDHDRIEAHLKACPECSDMVTFVNDFNSTLKAMSSDELRPDSPCPNADTIATFVYGELDESAAQAVRQHTIFCKECLEEVFLLRRAAEAAGIKTISEPSEGAARWRNVLEKAKAFIVDMGKTYGLDTIIGPARIVAEQPVFAMRGAQPSMGAGKVLEVAVGENTYSVEVKVNEDGTLSCDIAGVRTPVKEPLTVTAQSEAGDELLSVQTDQHGNTHFAVPVAEDPQALLLLTFKLKDREEQFLIRVSNTSEPV